MDNPAKAGCPVLRRTWAGVLLALIALVCAHRTGAAADSALTVRLTSPLGRTGTPGAVRIVARVQLPGNASVVTVRFYIDGAYYKTKDDAPHVVEWVDENPFERREIMVEVYDSLGRSARDTVVLEPFEVTDETDVFSVVLDAAVRDKNGRFITGLLPQHFAVIEEDVAQKPQLIGQESVPATFVLLVDSSQSMSRNYDFVRLASRRLLSYLKPKDRVIVAPFSKELGAITGPTNDHETILGAIGATSAAGGTAIFDSLQQASERIAPDPNRHAIILITDGYDENSQETFADAVEAIKRARATVYAVAIGGSAGVSFKGQLQLKDLAAQTGGRLFVPIRLEDLGPMYDQLAADAQNRYVITYTPANQVHDGAFRRVTVEAANTTGEQYRVTTRDGYFAPKAPPLKPMLEFTVTDENQELIDVTRDDLVVVEDGVEQTIETFQIAVDPVQIVLTLDESGSMRLAVEAVKDAAREFVRTLEEKDPLALITFSDRVQFAHDLTTVREWSFDAIDKYKALGGTALYDALYNSITRLKFVKGRRAVVILTDGRDENNPGTGPGSTRSINDVLARLKEVDAAIYPIGLGSRVDKEMLERIAQISGGRAYFPQDAAALAEQYRGIIENLRRRYVVGYSSTNTKRDGGWRNVDIKPREGTLQVRSRGGYFAPEK